MGCQTKPATVPYSFLVAGHVYGNPGKPQMGLYPPLMQQLDYLHQLPKVNFGFLTGDVVYKPTKAYWDAAIADINKFNFPLHIAAGNHDRGPIFESHYKSYYSFLHQNDLFIILSPTKWNIEEKQLEFFKTTLLENRKVVNVFIFVHELIWWSPENQFKNISINYQQHYPGKTNFWTTIHPILKALPQKVVLFAGDLGATPLVDTYMYYEEDNLTYIANGMGNGYEDYVILVKVHPQKGILFEVLDLNKIPPQSSINLKAYQIPKE